MVSELEPRDDADIEYEIETRLGLPGVVSVSWKRRWKARQDEMIDRALARAGATEPELGQRLRDDEAFGDVFWKAIQRAAEVADTEYADALGRIVGAALDDADIDEVAYLLSELSRLEPLHLRALMRCGFSAVFFDGEGRGRETTLEEANSLDVGVIQYRTLEQHLGVNTWVSESIVERLISAGFLVRRQDTLPPTYDSMSRARRSATQSNFQPTPMATAAVRLLFPNVASRTHYVSPNGPMLPGGHTVAWARRRGDAHGPNCGSAAHRPLVRRRVRRADQPAGKVHALGELRHLPPQRGDE